MKSPAFGASARPWPHARRRSGGSGWPISRGYTPDGTPTLPSALMGTSEAKVQVGRIWGRGIEWDAIRTLLAPDARTEMGRDRALTASPLTDATEVQTALDLTAEARRAITQEGAP